MNVMDYFALSPMYDRTCNNEVLKMQTKFNNLEELNHQLRYVYHELGQSYDPCIS